MIEMEILDIPLFMAPRAISTPSEWEKEKDIRDTWSEEVLIK